MKRGTIAGLVVGGAGALLLVSVLLPGSAGAAGRKTVKIPAQIEYVDLLLPGASKKDNRCLLATFAEFPEVKDAVSYKIVISDRDAKGKPPFSRSGPPFLDDTWEITVGKQYTIKIPAGDHWFWLAYGTDGQGCSIVERTAKGRFKIVSATATIDPNFVGPRLPPPPPPKPKRTLATPLDGPVLERSGTGITTIVNAGGEVYFYPVGSPQKIQRVTSTAAFKGPVIVVTGSKYSAAKFGFWENTNPAGEGAQYSIGPGATVRIEQGKPIQLLAWTPGAVWPVGYHQFVRTASAVVAARG